MTGLLEPRVAADSSRDLLVGVDVGGSTIGVLVTDMDGRPLARHTTETVPNRPSEAAQQVAAATFNCPRIEMAHRALQLTLGGRNPLVVQGGKMKVSALPGLGVEIDEKYLRANAAPGVAPTS